MKIDFSERSTHKEWMDDFSIGGPLIEQTLREIATINKWLGGNKITLNCVKHLIRESKNKTIRIVDIGCGGGEILRLIAKWCRKNKILVQLIGIDANPHVVQFAQQNSQDFPEIEYKAIDIFSSEFSAIKCDIILATLFTHHFTDDELKSLFKQFSIQSNQGVIINDLHRHWFAYYSIDWITRILSKSAMVRNDAKLSVLRSFSKKELIKLLKESGINNYSIHWKWAFRWQLIFSK